jgi:predicted secreted protein
MRKQIYICLITLLSSCAQMADNQESTLSNPVGPIKLGAGISRVLLTGQSALIVQVPSNPSTGYRWTLSLPPKAVNCLSILKDGEFLRDPNSANQAIPLVGAPGLQEWVIKPSCSGVFVLQWNSLRPWEKDQLPITTHQIRLEVTQ